MHIFQTDTGGEIEQYKQLTKKKKNQKPKNARQGTVKNIKQVDK